MHQISLVVSLLAPRETPEDIKQACAKLENMSWFHIPLEGAKEQLLKSEGVLKLLAKKYSQLYSLLQKEEKKVVLHCAAGIHRTGVSGFLL